MFLKHVVHVDRFKISKLFASWRNFSKSVACWFYPVNWVLSRNVYQLLPEQEPRQSLPSSPGRIPECVCVSVCLCRCVCACVQQKENAAHFELKEYWHCTILLHLTYSDPWNLRFWPDSHTNHNPLTRKQNCTYFTYTIMCNTCTCICRPGRANTGYRRWRSDNLHSNLLRCRA